MSLGKKGEVPEIGDYLSYVMSQVVLSKRIFENKRQESRSLRKWL